MCLLLIRVAKPFRPFKKHIGVTDTWLHKPEKAGVQFLPKTNTKPGIHMSIDNSKRHNSCPSLSNTGEMIPVFIKN